MDAATLVRKTATNSRYVTDRSKNILAGIMLFGLLMWVTACGSQGTNDVSVWTIYVTNDNCPDYTWGFTEEQTRQSFADIVRGHLDEMNRTDNQDVRDRDRYNMAVTQEALCFVERYPQRKAELIDRIKQGRIYVSPYLCNALWAFQSTEGAIRTFYPARRLETEWGHDCMGVAEHIEQPCLPWGVVPILAGCGIRWLSVPYYRYDSTFDGLTNPDRIQKTEVRRQSSVVCSRSSVLWPAAKQVTRREHKSSASRKLLPASGYLIIIVWEKFIR